MAKVAFKVVDAPRLIAAIQLHFIKQGLSHGEAVIAAKNEVSGLSPYLPDMDLYPVGEIDELNRRVTELEKRLTSNG